jgi:hypothetical protein
MRAMRAVAIGMPMTIGKVVCVVIRMVICVTIRAYAILRLVDPIFIPAVIMHAIRESP